MSMGIPEASRVLFVADGASWVWRRIPKLIAVLELTARQVQELIDFSHTVDYLRKTADSKKLKGAKCNHWLTIQKSWLLNGEIASVVIELETLLTGGRLKNRKDLAELFSNARTDESANGLLKLTQSSDADRKQCY